MESQPVPPAAANNCHFEFDHVNKILLMRVDGPLTEQLAPEIYKAVRRYSSATDARACIQDFSSVSEVALSADFIRYWATLEPAFEKADTRPRVMVFSKIHAYGLGRMLETLWERGNPLLEIVQTMDEALAALGVQSPHFEPLE